MYLRKFLCHISIALSVVSGLRAEDTPDRIRLLQVVPAAENSRLIVVANGGALNLALVDDKGDHAEILRTERVGQGPEIHAPFITSDGTHFGAVAGESPTASQGLHVFHAGDLKREVFAAFGDTDGTPLDFGVAADGQRVLVPGACGCVCWKFVGGEWKELWAIDDWKKNHDFDSGMKSGCEFAPSFTAMIPAGAEHALVMFNACAKNARGAAPENRSTSYLAALNLSDGKEQWHFDVPASKKPAFASVVTSPGGKHCLLQIQRGESFHFSRVDEGKIIGEWDSPSAPSAIAVAATDGRTALAFLTPAPHIDLRMPDGSLGWSRPWFCGIASLAFRNDAKTLFVADASGKVTRLDSEGTSTWSADVSCISHLAVRHERIYAAGEDGRLRCIDGGGRLVWTLDCKLGLNDATAKDAQNTGVLLVQASRPPTASPKVPKGANLLRSGKATLTLGGATSNAQFKAEALTNGKFDDVAAPWLTENDALHHSPSDEKVFAEIAFNEPTDVKTLTVYECFNHPEAWPCEGRIQVWVEDSKSWKTAARGVFLIGPINTYTLDLKSVTKLRYVPWSSSCRNFYTCEIELR